jgi:deoxyribonuclease-4
MSIAGGLHHAFEHAEAAGCDCLQVFVKNQRQWTAKPLTDEEIAAWNGAEARTRISPVVAHATYLINLAAADGDVRNKSVAAFAVELMRCHALGITGLVVHPGAHMGDGDETGIRRIADALDEVERLVGDVRAKVLLECTAGQGSAIGWRFEHLAEIRGRVRSPERVGVCIDTCHLFAAGYELRTQTGYDETMAAFDRVVGLEHLACIHVNDSVRELGSRVDRHAAIGEGEIGLAGFRHLVRDERLAAVPKILETPKGTDAKGRDLDRVNLGKLRRLCKTASATRR